MNWLNEFPDEKSLLHLFPETEVMNVNAHVHTPYSFSAFNDIQQIFRMAQQENIAVAGINDFFVTDGYNTFHDEALKHGVFPLFNIEFIALLKNEQQKNIRINDPNNPGRCYFCGKGLDYPFQMDPQLLEKLSDIISLSQVQMRAMIDNLNHIFGQLNSNLSLDFAKIRSKLARNLVRERHLAKAVRLAVMSKFRDPGQCITFFTELYGGKPPRASINDIPAIENEIRANLLKSGGRAFVEEDEATFLSLEEIIRMIVNAGGIPCYPVLLDDKNGNYTEFEESAEDLRNELINRNIGCIELIPGRNDASRLEKFADYFHQMGFIILLGTEHNAPEMIPLTCDTRGKVPLSEQMKSISYEGACVVAAHQYLRARKRQGYITPSGMPVHAEKNYFIRLGNAIIHYQKQYKKS